MFALILISAGARFGSYVATLVAGGVLGFLYGSRVEAKAQAVAASAVGAAKAEASKVAGDISKKL